MFAENIVVFSILYSIYIFSILKNHQNMLFVKACPNFCIQLYIEAFARVEYYMCLPCNYCVLEKNPKQNKTQPSLRIRHTHKALAVSVGLQTVLIQSSPPLSQTNKKHRSDRKAEDDRHLWLQL